LPKAPRRTLRELLGFKAGAQWIQMRWKGLANVVTATGEVSDAQRSTALDLLGVPADVREAATPPDLAGTTAAEARLEVAQAEILAMQSKIEGDLTKHDEDERARAELGLGTPTHEMRLVQRYLTAAYNRAEKAKKLINKHGANNRQAINPLERPGPKW